MRCLPPTLLLLMGCCAFGQAVAAPAKPAGKQAPARLAGPVPAPAKAFYAAMPDAERLAIQSDLIWTGDYNGVVGAEFADRAVAAVQAFQKRNGGKETGILNPEERAKLAQAARSRQEQAGWRVVDDAATGARLGIPQKLASQAAPAKAGSRWQSVHAEVQVETFRVAAPGTTLAAVFEQQRKEPADRRVEYNVLRPDFFVLSGLQGLKKFYVRGQVKGNEVRGLAILYDQALEGTWDRIAVAMSSAFAAFPAQGAAGSAGRPTPRRNVEYGTGLVVSAAGDIVTDGDLLTGCEFVAVPGLGYAERVAEDNGVALLRVNGASKLAPIALASGSPVGGDITLVGIADPQAQNGGSAVSTLRGRVVANGGIATVDPAPGAGFAGAAALDRDGNVTGLVGLRAAAAPAAANAQVMPAQAVAKFLDAQKIPSAAGRTGIESAKAAAVRVICVRK
jgi:Putative peptidoglycan binding domain